MADYPALTQVYGGRGDFRQGVEIDYLQGGQVNGRDFHASDKQDFDFEHIGISIADLQSVLDLFKEKGPDSFTFGSTHTGATHTVVFVERPEVTGHLGADKHNMRVRLAEV